MRNGTLRNDSMGVDLSVALEVVSLDAVKIGRVLESRVVPVEVLHPFVDEWISVANGAVVALEVSKVDWVKAHNGGVETNVGFGKLVSVQVGASVRQHLLNAIERVKERGDVGFVRFLGGSETALVDAVVDVRVDPFVESVDVGTVFFGVVGDTAVLFGEELVEGGVKVADELARFVVDNGVELGVPNDGDGAALRILGVSSKVETSNALLVLLTGDVVACAGDAETSGLFVRKETPTFSAKERVHDMDRKKVGNLVHSFELANDQSTVGPGTGECYDKMVAADFRLVLAALLDEVAEAGFLTTEVSVLVGPVGRAVLARVVVRHSGDRERRDCSGSEATSWRLRSAIAC